MHFVYSALVRFLLNQRNVKFLHRQSFTFGSSRSLMEYINIYFKIGQEHNDYLEIMLIF